VIFFLLLCPPLHADYQSGLDAYNKGYYKRAMHDWKEVAEQPPAQVNPAIYAETHYAIAQLYWNGQGVSRDYYQAREWLEKAADLGHADAMAKLGYLYTDGLTVEQNFNQAFEWFSRAARLGSVDGQYNLGIFYLNGWGTAQDTTMAKQYLAAASAQGDEAAEQALQNLLADSGEIPGQARDDGNEGESSRPRINAGAFSGVTGVVGRTSSRNSRSAAEPSSRNSRSEYPGSPSSQNAPVPSKKNVIPESAESSKKNVIPESAEGAYPGSPNFHDNPVQRQAESGSNQIDASNKIHNESWIRAQDPAHYTIQAIGLRSREKLLGLVEGHDELAPMAIYTVQKSSNPIYLLVQGVYQTAEEARAARDAFPRDINAPERVWIRRFEKIQEIIESEGGGE
jgi:septal ring-binding cell division protein DamX